MSLVESMVMNGQGFVVGLVQATLLALLGALAWLGVRRAGPALRAAVLLSALIGLIFVPILTTVAPVWLPFPELAWLTRTPSTFEPGVGVPATRPGPLAERAIAFVLTPPAVRPMPSLEESAQKSGPTGVARAKAEAYLIDLPAPGDEPAGLAHFAESPSPTRSWGTVFGPSLAVTWLFGALALMARTLLCLSRLYRCARRARPVHEEQCTACLESLTKRDGLAAVALRESPNISSPLTLGWCRPVILLPASRRDWSADQLTLVLEHELAHIRRRDFLSGLLAELAVCVYWFHPLVHWLVARLRLEQEHAADAWAASTAPHTRDYVRCLARLALETSRENGALAPAMWRRRPEIVRRIDMLRHGPRQIAPRLPRKATWTLAVLTTAACLAVAGVAPLPSAGGEQASDGEVAQAKPRPTADLHEDPLPAGALARLGTTRLRHAADVSFVAFGPDGKTLVTAGRDNTVRLWDLASGKEIRRFARPTANAAKGAAKGPNDSVQMDVLMGMMVGGGNGRGFQVALAPDGKTLAAAGGTVVQLWEVETGKELRRVDGLPNGAVSLVFSPDSKTLAARGPGGYLYLWEADTGRRIHTIKPAPRPKQDGIVLAFGGGPADAPGMAFTPDSKGLAAAAAESQDGTTTGLVKIWDVATGKELGHIPAPQGVAVSSVAIGGGLLAYGGGNVVHVCDFRTCKELRQLKAPGGRILSLVFSPDGRVLAVRGVNQSVRLWDTESGKELQQLTDAEPRQQTGGLVLFTNTSSAGPETRALAFSADGKQLASAAGSTVRLWDLASGNELPLQGGHWRSPTAIVLQSDGKTVVSWGADRVVRRWRALDGQPLSAFAAPLRTVRAALAADGQAIALANADKTIRIHATATGKELYRLKGPEGGVSALAFAPGGKMLAVRSGANTVYLFDGVRGTELRQINLQPATNPARGNVIILGGPPQTETAPGVAFSPDGRLLLVPVSGGSNSNTTLAIMDTATGKALRPIESPRRIASFAFSPDGRSVATENADHTVTLWEVASGKQQAQMGKAVGERPRQQGAMIAFDVAIDGLGSGMSEPSGPVGVMFSSDGRALAVRVPGRQVCIYDVAAGKEIGRFKGHGGRVETVAFAHDSRALATGAGDTTILLWDTTLALRDLVKPQPIDLERAAMESLWSDLSSADAVKALTAVRQLAAASARTVGFLAQRLKPTVRVDAKQLEGWIADLDSDKFAVRQQASANLLKSGPQAVPALEKVLTSRPQLETRQRVRSLLDKLSGRVLTSEELRLVRAIDALERMGTSEARKLLRMLAEGAPGALPTRESQAALGRLK